MVKEGHSQVDALTLNLCDSSISEWPLAYFLGFDVTSVHNPNPDISTVSHSHPPVCPLNPQDCQVEASHSSRCGSGQGGGHRHAGSHC